MVVSGCWGAGVLGCQGAGARLGLTSGRRAQEVVQAEGARGGHGARTEAQNGGLADTEAVEERGSRGARGARAGAAGRADGERRGPLAQGGLAC